jgi:hypothetical protein
MSGKVYLIEAWENHKWGWKRINDINDYTVIGYKSIYYVDNSKIYLAKFKQTIPLSRIDRKCVNIYYQGRWTVKKCEPRVMDVIMKKAKEIKQIPEDDQFLYQFLDVIEKV